MIRSLKKVILSPLLFTGILMLTNITGTAFMKASISPKAQMVKATTAVSQVEKLVNCRNMDISKVRKQLGKATKELSKVKLLGSKYKKTYIMLQKRYKQLNKKIAATERKIVADKKEEKIKLDAYAELIKAAELSVSNAEKLKNNDNHDLVEAANELDNADNVINSASEKVALLKVNTKEYNELSHRLSAVAEYVKAVKIAKAKADAAQCAKKPVIYLYPTKEQDINVKLNGRVKLQCDYPKYDINGWDVTAKPDGTLIDKKTNMQYYCLYWEGTFDNNFNTSSGFVIAGKDTAVFLEDKLKTLGLNEKEANEFIIYWLPILEKNEYNLIRFETDDYNSLVPMDITPKPDSLIRILMTYKPLEKPIDIKQQQLTTPTRKGFTVVEWGGMEIK